jgi:isochorismate pyruvate lyase
VCPNMKPPEQCEGLTEIRTEIDRLDHQLIRLLSERFGYVKAAARFKEDQAAVAAPDRLKAMIEQRRLWAVEEGLSPDVIEKLYRDLVTYFIGEEMKHWEKVAPRSQP